MPVGASIAHFSLSVFMDSGLLAALGPGMTESSTDGDRLRQTDGAEDPRFWADLRAGRSDLLCTQPRAWAEPVEPGRAALRLRERP